MPTVTFQPSARQVQVEQGTSLLAAATEAGLTGVECCGKVVACGLCKAAVLDGEEHLTPPEAQEADFRARRRFLPYERLGCMAYVTGDVEVEVER